MPRISAIALSLLLALYAGPAVAGGGSGSGGGEGKDTAAEDTPGGMSVDEAWEQAKRDWQELQDASGEAWEKAKQEFDESWSALKERLQDEPPGAPEEAPEEKQ
jgi:hypothetical protein